MQALNKKEVNSKSLQFWLRFAVLIFAMLFVVYFFVWASVMETKKYTRDLINYKRIENKQIQLSYKIDSLYWYIGQLAPQVKTDEKFLISYLREQKQNILDICAKDSSSGMDFAGYKKIMSRLDEQLGVRDSIIAVEKANDDLKRSLDDCNSKNVQLNKAMTSN